MNKKLLVSFVVIVIVLVVFITFKQGENTESFIYDKQINHPQLQEPIYEFVGTQDQLMVKGGNYYCTFVDRGHPEIDIPGSSGYFYIAGEKARGYEKSDSGWVFGIRELYIIRDGDTIYRWRVTKTDTSRSKISLPTKLFFDKEKVTSNLVKAGWNQDGSQKYMELKKEVSTYKCNAWSPEYSLFEIPKSITFETNSDLIY